MKVELGEVCGSVGKERYTEQLLYPPEEELCRFLRMLLRSLILVIAAY